MRLWHVDLLPHLPRQQLLGQHRECCALRGKGWGKKHSTIDYVFEHGYWSLCWYHRTVMFEMMRRGYQIGNLWWNPRYRGKSLGGADLPPLGEQLRRYPEHDESYLRECIENLREKGIEIQL